MLPIASMNAVRHSGSSIKIKSLHEEKGKKFSKPCNPIFLSENSSLCPENLILPLATGSTSSVTTAWHEEKPSPAHTAESPQLMKKPCSKPALKIIKAQACIPWNFVLGLQRGPKAWWLTLALGSAWVAEERLSWNLTQVNVGTGSKVTSSSLDLFMCSLAEPFVFLMTAENELTAEKLEICPHHILPLTLHPLLVLFRSALELEVEANRHYSHGDIRCCLFSFCHLTLLDVVQRAEIQLSKTLQSLPSWAFDLLQPYIRIYICI